MSEKLPRSASVATPAEGAKLYAPAAARNGAAICALLSKHGVSTGRALEVASGTGQHVTVFAEALPGVFWQPTELAQDRLASINAYGREAGLSNLLPARRLDATMDGWHHEFESQDMVVLVNLLHLIAEVQAETVIREALLALRSGGRFVLYGPFMRSGQLISEGDATFDAQLRAADPAIGYKDDQWVKARLQQAGCRQIDAIDMPANNLAFVATR